MSTADPLRALARLVIETLDAQQRYFQTKAPSALYDAKQYERSLRKAAEAALAANEPRLFP